MGFTKKQEERILKEANYIVDYNATVRETAKIFGVSKSTVYLDVAEKLFWLDPVLFKKVEKVLAKNKAERHIRGGYSTKVKYQKKRLERVNKT